VETQEVLRGNLTTLGRSIRIPLVRKSLLDERHSDKQARVTQLCRCSIEIQGTLTSAAKEAATRVFRLYHEDSTQQQSITSKSLLRVAGQLEPFREWDTTFVFGHLDAEEITTRRRGLVAPVAAVQFHPAAAVD
jgi:hypothetical protein